MPTHLFDHASEFSKSPFSNSEIRNAVRAARSIFACNPPIHMTKYFRGPSRDEKTSKTFREMSKRRYACDFDTITFEDIFKEVDARTEELQTICDEWRKSSSDWSPN